jgi:hypothetical protein
MANEFEFVWKRSWPNSRHHSDTDMTNVNGITKILVDCRLRTAIQELGPSESTQHAYQPLGPDTSWVVLLRITVQGVVKILYPLKYLVNF